MQKAAGLAGGVRFGPDGNEVIPASPDVADMTEDDVMLMTVSEDPSFCVALTARFPVGKPVVPAALMNRPTRGERRFAYWALFRFLAH